MAKKVNGFASAMNEALMGRPSDNNVPMNPPQATEQQSSSDVSPKSKVEIEEKNVFKELPAYTEEEMDKLVSEQRQKSKKIGRPKEISGNTKPICINFPVEDLKILDVLCKVQNVSRSKYLISLLEKDIKLKEDVYQSYIKMFGEFGNNN